MNNTDKYATIIRYLITMFAAPFAARYITDPAVLQNFTDALLALVLSLVTIGPLVYNMLTRPSSAAMKVAVQADKVLAGDKPQAIVVTPPSQPDLVVKPAPANSDSRGK